MSRVAFKTKLYEWKEPFLLSIVDAALHVSAVHTGTQCAQTTVHKEGSGVDEGLWWMEPEGRRRFYMKRR